MTNEKRPIKQDLMLEVRRLAIPIGFWSATIIAGLLIGLLTGWKY